MSAHRLFDAKRTRRNYVTVRRLAVNGAPILIHHRTMTIHLGALTQEVRGIIFPPLTVNR